MDHLRLLLMVYLKATTFPVLSMETTVRPALEIANHHLVTVPDCCKMDAIGPYPTGS